MKKTIALIAVAVLLCAGALTWHFLSDDSSANAESTTDYSGSALGSSLPTAAHSEAISGKASDADKNFWYEAWERVEITRREHAGTISEMSNRAQFESYRQGMMRLVQSSAEASRYAHPLHLAGIRSGSVKDHNFYYAGESQVADTVKEVAENLDHFSSANRDAAISLQTSALEDRTMKVQAELKVSQQLMTGSKDQELDTKKLADELKESSSLLQ